MSKKDKHNKTLKRLESSVKVDLGGKASEEFTRNLQLAARAATGGVIAALPIFVPAIGDMIPQRFQGLLSGTVVMSVMSFQPVWGSTLKGAMTGCLGIFICCLNMFMINNIWSPNEPRTVTSVYFAVVNITMFNFVILWLNVSHGVRCWAISLQLFKMMEFLDPRAKTSFLSPDAISEMFSKIDPTDVVGMMKAIAKADATFTNLIVIFMGSCIAVMMALLPYPIGATELGQKGCDDISKGYADLLKQICRFHTETTSGQSDLQVNMWIAPTAKLKGLVGSTAGRVAPAFTEACCSSSKRDRAKIVQAFTGFAPKLHDNVVLLQDAAKKSAKNKEEHSKFMENGVADGITKLQASMADLFESLAEATTNQDKNKIQSRVDALVEARKALNSAVPKKQLSSGNLGDLQFVFVLDALAAQMEEFGDEMSDEIKADSLGKDCANNFTSCFDMAVCMERRHLNWAIRNTLALVTGFVIAVYCFDFAGSIPCTIAFLLPTTIATSLQQNGERLLGAVLGSVYPAYIKLIFADCTPWGRFWLMCILWTYLVFMMSVSLSGGKFSFVATLCAIFGACQLTTGCTKGAPFGFSGMNETAIAVLIMCVIDLVFNPESPSRRANGAIDEAMAATGDACSSFFTCLSGKGDVAELKTHIGAVGGKTGQCQGFLGEAAMEPRFTKTPFRTQMFTSVLEQLDHVRLHMEMLKTTIDPPQSEAGSVDEETPNKSNEEFRRTFHEVLESKDAKILDDDLAKKIELMHGCIEQDLESVYELIGAKPSDFKLQGLADEWVGADEIINSQIPKIISLLNEKLKNATTSPDFLVWDMSCRAAATIAVLQAVVADLMAIEEAILLSV